MTTGKRITLILCLGSILPFWGCSSEKGGEVGKRSANPEEDRREIQATLTEIATRWRYGDKVTLYENEFEYTQIEYNYDKYLEIPQVKRMESDTVHSFVVNDVQFFEGDSARVAVDVVFVGPSEDTTHRPQNWTMYYDHGRWIRPTISTPNLQREFNERRRKADSAAEAEENEKW